MTRLLLRVYAAALVAYPPSLRRDHAAEMLQCARAAVSARGASALLPLFADLAASVPREWLLSMKGVPMNGLARDLVYALRLLWRSPGFSVAAVVTLALGIGANAAIFSLADSTLLRPLKVARPSELYVPRFSSSYPEFTAYQQLGTVFAGVGGSAGGRVNAVIDGRAEFASAVFVSGAYFDVLGVPPVAGRLFRAGDDDRNGPGVAVLTERWWRSRFGGDPGVIGRTMHVNNVPVTILGVAGRQFQGTSMSEPARLFLPLTQTPRIQTGFFARPTMLTNRGMSWISVVMRLRPGVTPSAAAAAADAVYRQLHPVRSGTRPDPIALTPLGRRSLGGSGLDNLQRFVILLAAVVGLTLLIGCANVANLLLARAAARRRELGVRMAIGASRGRVVRQLLAESLVLAAIGGLASVTVATIGLRLLARFQLPGGIEIDGLDLALSTPVLAFTMAVAAVTGVLFGLAPAWRAARADVVESLRDGARAAASRGGLRSWLVATQVGLSLVLLAGTGVFLRSLSASLRAPLGFRVEQVATASVNLGAARYDLPRAREFYTDALTRVKRLPGVTAAAWTSLVPTLGSRSMSATFEGYQAAPQEDPHVYNTAVTPEYFDAVGTRLLRGRPFAATDTAASPLVAIINETAARRYFAGREAVGGRVMVDDKHWIEIVGVAEDATQREIGETPEPFLYSPFTQDPFGDQVSTVHLMVRTSGDEEALLAPLAGELRAIDPRAPVYDVSTFTWRVRRLVMPQRMGATLFGAFASLALVLSTLGIYAVASYVARLRTREIGIRIALGADRARIRRLVLRQGAVPVVAGIAAGLAASAIAGRFATAFLRGVSARDPITYATVAALLAAVAFVATWVPARRAAAVDPIRALRHE
jgi:putative ABC transport system permease protein